MSLLIFYSYFPLSSFGINLKIMSLTENLKFCSTSAEHPIFPPSYSPCFCYVWEFQLLAKVNPQLWLSNSLYELDRFLN